MTLTIPFVAFPRAKERKHRQADTIRRLRREKRDLLDRQRAADDYFARLRTDRADVYAALQFAEHGRQAAEAIVIDQENQIRDLKRQLAEAQRRLEIGVLAEAAATRTQELDASGLRDNYSASVRTLQQAHCIGPVLNPGRVHSHGAC